jgi:peptidoglycan hydrolase-like protein with peptidoglycan-binding domain
MRAVRQHPPSRPPAADRCSPLSAGAQVDGVFGPQSDAAVRGFQHARSLDIPAVAVDGIVDPVTWQARVSGMLSGYAISPLSASPNADQNRWNHSPPAALTFPLG